MLDETERNRVYVSLEDLQTFRVVTELGSFSRAAENKADPFMSWGLVARFHQFMNKIG